MGRVVIAALVALLMTWLGIPQSAVAADGATKAISQIQVGDEIVATDPETGEQAPKTVQHVFVHDDTLTDLELADGTVLTTTADHPFWSDTDQTFEPADQLTAGERVLTADGTTITVTGLKPATARTGPPTTCPSKTSTPTTSAGPTSSSTTVAASVSTSRQPRGPHLRRTG